MFDAAGWGCAVSVRFICLFCEIIIKTQSSQYNVMFWPFPCADIVEHHNKVMQHCKLQTICEFNKLKKTINYF